MAEGKTWTSSPLDQCILLLCYCYSPTHRVFIYCFPLQSLSFNIYFIFSCKASLSLTVLVSTSSRRLAFCFKFLTFFLLQIDYLNCARMKNREIRTDFNTMTVDEVRKSLKHVFPTWNRLFSVLCAFALALVRCVRIVWIHRGNCWVKFRDWGPAPLRWYWALRCCDRRILTEVRDFAIDCRTRDRMAENCCEHWGWSQSYRYWPPGGTLGFGFATDRRQ